MISIWIESPLTWIAMIPAGHGFFGKSGVSYPRVRIVCRHVYARPFLVPLSVVVDGLPTVMRKPLGQLTTFPSDRPDCITYWRKRSHGAIEIGTIEVLLGIVYCHTSLDVVCILTFKS
jgi:hypothetical protein